MRAVLTTAFDIVFAVAVLVAAAALVGTALRRVHRQVLVLVTAALGAIVEAGLRE